MTERKPTSRKQQERPVPQPRCSTWTWDEERKKREEEAWMEYIVLRCASRYPRFMAMIC